MIGLTCMFSQTHLSLQVVTKKVKQIAPETLIAVGGVHVSNALADDKTSETFIT